MNKREKTSNIRNVIALAMFSFLIFVTSCSKDNQQTSIDVTASLSSETVNSSISTDTLRIQTSGGWDIYFDYPDDNAVGWCKADVTFGTGNKDVILTCSNNTTATARAVKIHVRSATSEVVITLNQSAYERPADAGWLELPDFGKSITTRSLTHYTAIGGNPNARSYTALYDSIAKISYWVAYPFYRACVGGSGRTDAWGYDPSISTFFQPNYASGINSNNPGTIGYDRGHQIPSADRTSSKAANNQTFYYTNMTPQSSDLNQKLWANLENKVRNEYMPASDTLYVVTGAILQTVGGNEIVDHIKDSSGKLVAVPNYYYKVLLRLKAGKYDAIGFWFENKNYGNVPVTSAYAKKVSDIEALTGFNFFKNLPVNEQNIVENELIPKDWGL